MWTESMWTGMEEKNSLNCQMNRRADEDFFTPLRFNREERRAFVCTSIEIVDRRRTSRIQIRRSEP